MISIVVVAGLGIGWWLASPLFIDKVVNEEPVMAEHETEKDDMKEEEMDSDMKEDDSSSQDGLTNDTMEKSETYTGSFTGADSSHQAMGIVTVSEKNVRLEDFEVTNGPDLYVYLVEEGQETKEGVSLGKLKGNIGNQNYELPEDKMATDGMKIVIWCKQFNKDFGMAELSKGM